MHNVRVPNLGVAREYKYLANWNGISPTGGASWNKRIFLASVFFWSCEVGTNLIRKYNIYIYIYIYIYIRIYIYIHPMYVQVAILCIMIIHPVLCRYHQLPFPFFFRISVCKFPHASLAVVPTQLNIIDTQGKVDSVKLVKVLQNFNLQKPWNNWGELPDVCCYL